MSGTANNAMAGNAHITKHRNEMTRSGLLRVFRPSDNGK
jgi:hypothetical protein